MGTAIKEEQKTESASLVAPKLSVEIPEKWKLLTPLKQDTYLVNGELRKWEGTSWDVKSTLTEEQNYVGSYPALGKEQALEILDAAVKAYNNGLGEWPQKSLQERIKAVSAFIDDFEKSREEVVKLLVWEVGKTAPDAYREFDRTVSYLRETIRYLKSNGAKQLPANGLDVKSERQALGVALCMGPFNYPLNETLTTVIPALLMGNSVIMKPAKLGVLLYQPVLEAFKKHFPPGVINFVYGDGQEVITPLMQSGKIDALSFIGSTKVADILIKQHPQPHRLKLLLGLGAKNPAVITPSANLFAALDKVVKGALSYNGQRCTALKAIFVHDSVYDEFSKLLAFKIDRLKAGMPWEDGVNITPLAETGKQQYFEELVQDAVLNGAKILNQNGGSKSNNIYFPVVLGDVSDGMRIFREEQFGPVVPLIRYKDSKEIAEYMATSGLGQQVSIFSEDREEIGRLSNSLRRNSARININEACERGPDHLPFAARGSSGQGVISIADALKEFSVESLVVEAK